MPSKLKPPTNLSDESLLEWDRIVSEMEAQQLDTKRARAMLTLYCQAWQTAQAVYPYVQEFGAVIRWTNGQPCPSPFHRVWLEATKMCEKLLLSLGLGPKAAAPVEEEKLEF